MCTLQSFDDLIVFKLQKSRLSVLYFTSFKPQIRLSYILPASNHRFNLQTCIWFIHGNHTFKCPKNLQICIRITENVQTCATSGAGSAYLSEYLRSPNFWWCSCFYLMRASKCVNPTNSKIKHKDKERDRKSSGLMHVQVL